ncbi:probable serine threonine- kinase DDB_G0271682 [Paramuricea clavata]|uniref:Probable serine threonine- kinase DDB_G0271682 n=1 Tax=Paramuricea clavata TaxID=317549 RepID=A0A7D9IA18_PARCT|nr:probable serine threonine- kinase DDB_G0271682 [Paramuricea clavata]
MQLLEKESDDRKQENIKKDAIILTLREAIMGTQNTDRTPTADFQRHELGLFDETQQLRQESSHLHNEIQIKEIQLQEKTMNKNEIQQLREENTNKDNEILELRQDNNKRNNEILQLQQLNTKNDNEILELQQENINKENELQQHRQENINKENELQQRRQENVNKDNEIQQLRQDNNKKNSEILQLQQLNTKNDNEILELRQENINKNNEVQQLRQDNININSEIQEVREENNNLQSEIQRLREENNGLKTNCITERGSVVVSKNDILGRGAYGCVYAGDYNGTNVAVKEYYEIILSSHNLQMLQREINIASQCSHPNLLQFICAIENDQSHLLIVTELMDMNLRLLLEQRESRLEYQEVKLISLDVARGLNYLHLKTPNTIIHRDVSSANVLLWVENGAVRRAKVSDYGSANFMQVCNTANPGAAICAAPEANQAQQDPKIDVFSYGVLVCEMSICELPVPAQRKIQIKGIPNGGVKKMVQNCTHIDAGKRPTMQEVRVSLTLVFPTCAAYIPMLDHDDQPIRKKHCYEIEHLCCSCEASTLSSKQHMSCVCAEALS